jgi:predicted membrane metal-binding protein
MSKKAIFLITVLLMLANIPWFFTNLRREQILGFPPWAIYSLSMMVLFALVVCFLLGRYWARLAGDDDGEPTGNTGCKKR